MTTVASVLNGANNSSSYPLINVLGNSPLSALGNVALDLGNNVAKWGEQDQKKIKEDAQRQANASFLNKQFGLTLDKDVDPDLAIKTLAATAKDNKVTHTFKGADGNMYGVRGDGAALNLGVKAFNEDKQNIHWVAQPGGRVAAIKLNLETGKPEVIDTGVYQDIRPTYSPNDFQSAIANFAGQKEANIIQGKNDGRMLNIAQNLQNNGSMIVQGAPNSLAAYYGAPVDGMGGYYAIPKQHIEEYQQKIKAMTK